MRNDTQVYEINIFALVLVVQSLPFLAAGAMAALECSRFNEFGYWRGVKATVATTLVPQAPVSEAPVQLPGEKRVETIG